MFRQVERWLHQHIFKIGWLLSNSLQTTTIIYYIFFLPGITLHEATRWLAAFVLNARAERAIGFPETQDLGELRLNFIRLANDVGPVKRIVIGLCPLAVGTLALWAISARVFRWEAILALATDGSAEGLLAALRTFTGAADVWLWFYMAFVIANTMFPRRSQSRVRRETALVLAIAPVLALGAWRIGGAAYPAIGAAVEAMLRGVGLIIAPITLVNICALAFLGALESLIESASDRRATFRDGKLITTTPKSTLEPNTCDSRSPREANSPVQTRASAPSLNSIYEVKLPIPGPPGREPVSRSVVSVIMPDEQNNNRWTDDDATSSLESPAPSFVEGDSADADTDNPPSEPMPNPTRSRNMASKSPPDSVEAPFPRPFVNSAFAGERRASWSDQAEPDVTEPFARPFRMTSRADEPAADASPLEPGAQEDQKLTAEPVPQTGSRMAPSKREQYRSRTRPAPKPSARAERARQPETVNDSGELEYSALQDDMAERNDGEGFYDDER